MSPRYLLHQSTFETHYPKLPYGLGGKVVSDEGLQKKLLEVSRHWLEAQDLGEEDVCEVMEGQPLRLKLLRKILEAVGGPDREFLRHAEKGLRMGIRYPLSRTPHVFEEQLRWPLDNQPRDLGYAGCQTTAR